MNRLLKHKLLLVLMGIGLVAALATPSAQALTLDSGLTQRVAVSTQGDGGAGSDSGNEGDINCPSGQVPVKSEGQTVARTCCPESVAYKLGADRPKSCLFTKYINPLITLLSAVVGVVVVIGVIYGAIQVSSSAGDPQKSAQGKEHIRNALFGLLAYILLYAFLQFIIPGGRFN
jgi:hypothetical protein